MDSKLQEKLRVWRASGCAEGEGLELLQLFARAGYQRLCLCIEPSERRARVHLAEPLFRRSGERYAPSPCGGASGTEKTIAWRPTPTCKRCLKFWQRNQDVLWLKQFALGELWGLPHPIDSQDAAEVIRTLASGFLKRAAAEEAAIRLAREGDRVRAIQRYREALGGSLKQAKSAVDRLLDAN